LDVKLHYVDDDFNTVDKADSTQRVYVCRVTRSVTGGPTFSAATVIPAGGTTSTIAVTSAYTSSTPPLDGHYQIACKNADGNEFVTRSMSIWTEPKYIEQYLHWDIPHLQLKTKVWRTGIYEYGCNGIDIAIHFLGLHAAQEQCEIRSSETTPITGGNNLQYKGYTDRSYGTNLIFEPIPLEMLYASAEKPQVLIKVNGIEGVCPEFNCDYVYTQPTSEITVQALANGNELTITGTALPTTDVRVVLGNAECGTVTASETEITCTLGVLPAAGSWDVQVYDPKGLVPIADAVVKIDVALTVSAISPSTDLN